MTVRAYHLTSAIREQLQRHRDLTIELLWEEDREHNPEGYSYSQFCKLYRRSLPDALAGTDFADAGG